MQGRRVSPIDGQHALIAGYGVVPVGHLPQQVFERPAPVGGSAHHGRSPPKASTMSADNDISRVALMNQELVEAESLLFSAPEIQQLLRLGAAQGCNVARIHSS